MWDFTYDPLCILRTQSKRPLLIWHRSFRSFFTRREKHRIFFLPSVKINNVTSSISPRVFVRVNYIAQRLLLCNFWFTTRKKEKKRKVRAWPPLREEMIDGPFVGVCILAVWMQRWACAHLHGQCKSSYGEFFLAVEKKVCALLILSSFIKRRRRKEGKILSQSHLTLTSTGWQGEWKAL